MRNYSKNQLKLMSKLKQDLNEATSSGASSGKYVKPLSLGLKLFDDKNLQPYTIPTSKYDDAELAYDSYDGEMSTDEKEIDKLETKARSQSIYDKLHPQLSDDDGNVLNADNLNEDLAVWFGTKKKPKGSKQPKGPWVNICRKVDGKHPPCGRSDADTKSYPKCRAAGVAGKMSDSEKKAACAQKRRAEKKEPKYGKGNKPTMVSYKPKKESIEKTIKRVLKEEIFRIY